MNKKVLFLVLGSLVTASAAHADGCPGGDPASQVAALSKQTDALNTALGGGSNGIPTNGGDQPPAPANKPDESVIQNVINCLQPIAGSNAEARVRAEADVQLSTLYGLITQFYRSGLGKQGPGKVSYFDLRAATEVDATFMDSWMIFGQVVDGFSSAGWFDRRGIEMGLGINIGDERGYAIQGLEKQPQLTPEGQQLLQKLKSY